MSATLRHPRRRLLLSMLQEHDPEEPFNPEWSPRKGLTMGQVKKAVGEGTSLGVDLLDSYDRYLNALTEVIRGRVKKSQERW